MRGTAQIFEDSRMTVDFLPQDWRQAALVGRIDAGAGPTPVVVRAGRVMDVSGRAPTVSALLDAPTDDLRGEDLGDIRDLGFQRAWAGAAPALRLLAPVDLHCVKAAGVTFAVSAIERVIEERARGDAAKADAQRAALEARVGADIRSVKPGSAEAARLKEALIADGLWSQYLEVAIGPDAEIFTKAPILAAVGWGDYAGVRSNSHRACARACAMRAGSRWNFPCTRC